MPRIRTTKPEFYSDPDLGRLSLEARYLYKGTWTFADDEGRIPADPRLLKSEVFPYDDKLTTRKVERLIDEIVSIGKALRYEVDGVEYLFLPNFKKHQRIDKPQAAKYPGPPLDHSQNGSGTLLPLKEGIGKEGNVDPPTPASGGASKLNPRAQGTNPRAVAAKKRDAENAARQAEIEACPDCDDRGIVYDEGSDTARKCDHRKVAS